MASDVPFAGKGSRSRVDNRKQFADNFDKIFRKGVGDEEVGTRQIPLVDLLEDQHQVVSKTKTPHDGHPIRAGGSNTTEER